jgi:hypothetical protein
MYVNGFINKRCSDYKNKYTLNCVLSSVAKVSYAVYMFTVRTIPCRLMYTNYIDNSCNPVRIRQI